MGRIARVIGASLTALLAAILLVSATSVQAREHWYSGEGYDWWSDCSDVPDPIEFLPIYLGNESPGFVDLHRTITRQGVDGASCSTRATRTWDRLESSAGRWYGGMGADEWPAGSLDAARHLERFHVTAWEIDGNRHAVDPACVVVLRGDDHTIGFYNAWVRFNEPGQHTLKIFGRQVLDFFFVYPFAETGLSDPFGLEGRRVFLSGEAMGDSLDDEFTHTYELNVGRY